METFVKSKNDYLPLDSRNKKSYFKQIFLYSILVIFFFVALLFFVAYFASIVLVFSKLTSRLYNLDQPVCSETPDLKKIDCYPDGIVTEENCLSRGCCFSIPKNLSSRSHSLLGVPYCYYPSNYIGYAIKDISKTSRGMLVKLERARPSGFSKDVTHVNLLVSFIDDYSLRVKILDANSKRFEVPIQLYYQTEKLEDPLYDVSLDPSSGMLTIQRKSSKSVVFKTDLSLLVFSDQFLQLSSELPSKYVYGIGEQYSTMLRDVNWTRFTLLNSDQAPIPNHALYGSQPFYMSLDGNGSASGVLLFNSNIMDVILKPTPAITFRPIGGILDFFILLGPSPKDVVRQYSNIVGKTILPPYWSLGFHLCRYGYKTLNETREVLQRNLDAFIPIDVQWNDIDYMDENKDFTYSKTNFAGLPEFVQDLHDKGMHYVIMTDPGLSNTDKDYPPYDEGLDDDIFVKNENGTIFVGKVWTSGTTVFPDFSHPSAVNFWSRQFQRFHEDVKFDGVWIDMNEPSNFVNGGIDGCPDSPLENPQYVPGGNALRTKTVCMSAKHYYTTHYNEHNIYGYREAVATNKALTSVRKKRPFIISRATFPGQGVYSGHWSGDVFSTWEDMRYTVVSLINFNMYAIPMVGSDICGFNGNTTVELCARWQALGAFYPFARNHNERVTIAQDPAALGPIVMEATRNSLERRYNLLPYLYTLFYRSHIFGDAVVRPLFFEYPEDPKTYNIDEQFLWGSSLMIVPVLYPNTTNVSAYFPEDLWYSEFGEPIKSSGERVSVEIPLTDIHLYMRGGIIIPGQGAGLTTTESRKNPFLIGIVLDEEQKASGELYWDDGDSLETVENEFYNHILFEATPGQFNSSVVKSGYKTEMNVSVIEIIGLNKTLSEVKVNGKTCSSGSVKDPHSSNVNKDASSIKFLNMNAVYNLMSANTTCEFFILNKYYVIRMTPVSLLLPITVEWK